MSEHWCVDCRALPEQPPPYDTAGMTVDELLALPLRQRPEGGYRPLRPRAIDPRSDPPRCYSHYDRARRAGVVPWVVR